MTQRGRLCLYFRRAPEPDRWFPGDRYPRRWLRTLIRRPFPGGVDRVFLNLRAGLDRLGIPYEVNLPFDQLEPQDRMGVLGVGKYCLKGYNRPNCLVAGIGLMTHPSEWPTLFEDYPVITYLHASQWVSDYYRPYFGSRSAIWPVGIDTEAWRPLEGRVPSIDFLIYDKISWNPERDASALLDSVRRALRERGSTVREIRYGAHRPEQFHSLLQSSRAMIFLCEHESQGLAYQEALSCNVPILALNPEKCQEPDRSRRAPPRIPASSVPYWDDRCGLTFRDAAQFPTVLEAFEDKRRQGHFSRAPISSKT